MCTSVNYDPTQFTGLARKLARQVSRSPADEDDLMQEGLSALHYAFGRTTEIRNLTGFVSCAMRMAMINYYKPSRLIHDVPLNEHDPVQREWLEKRTSPAHEIFERLEMSEYFDQLERKLGSTARWVAENLVTPGPELGQHILEEVERKKEDVANGQVRHGIKLSVRVSRRQLRECAGIPDSQWFPLIREIKQFTLAWLAT